jgi:acetyltransferase-like isoleucine patch superfamily enzyme
VEIGEGTEIGFLTIIRGRHIRIGPFVQIGSTTFLDTPHIEIGEGSRINEQVFVGGLQRPDSRFVMGRNSQVMQMTFINPARSVVIGDDSGVGGDCLIFGHTSWLSRFEGYPVEFEPVEIGNSVSLSWRVFLLPGSRVGDGAVVGANSVVRGTIPPRCLAVGFPARVVSRFPEFPAELTSGQRVEIFRGILDDMIGYFQASGLDCRAEGDAWEISQPSSSFWRRSRGPWRLTATDGDPEQAIGQAAASEVFLSLEPVSASARARLDAAGTLWIEVAGKARSRLSNDLGEEVALFLKRYGVRTLRSD